MSPRQPGSATATPIHPAAVYRATRRPEALPPDLRLRSIEWGVLFALSGRHTVAQIGEQFGLAAETRDTVFRRLVAAGLAVERELALHEYLRAAATSGGPDLRTFGQYLSSAPLASVARPAVSAPATGLPRPTARAPAGRRPAPPPFEPLALAPETPPMLTSPAKTRALSLKALMRFVRERAGDETAGQLDIYRAFLKVDPSLLRRNGISTLRFEDDRLVTDAELQRSIVASVEESLGVRCPPEVFVS